MGVKDIVIKDGKKYCPHCGVELYKVIVETKGWGKIRVSNDVPLGMSPVEGNEIEYYISYECDDCGGELSE